ncbi:MAG: hypothetical protein P1Q69_12860 [Candidatus Thorarchaeota archaeon]|nr:hypothetical protein [Candidatus Thorarchaeota archaeon]
MIGLGVWLLYHRRTIPKASRNIRSEKKSLPPQKSPASKGRSVANCYDQTSLMGLVSSKVPAMVNAVETSSASRPTGEFGIAQRTEARSHRRNDIPMKKGKACNIVDDSGQRQAGDSGREKGRTQEFLTVHSQL